MLFGWSHFRSEKYNHDGGQATETKRRRHTSDTIICWARARAYMLSIHIYVYMLQYFNQQNIHENNETKEEERKKNSEIKISLRTFNYGETLLQRVKLWTVNCNFSCTHWLSRALSVYRRARSSWAYFIVRFGFFFRLYFCLLCTEQISSMLLTNSHAWRRSPR